ncbi:hypothetical protein [Pelagibius sp. Alg239-R121]|uniref:hypothetical protein n=1 Tax=Pelagibius sp. Alg239-R121 TaxID=2993448 RepID=UPI0024A687BE|nr:hypothetical protein [Pelagibius sp. Alg239-R121]
MSATCELRALAPTELCSARAIAHKAVQLATKAARANLDPAPDDSHSNLGWDPVSKQFLSQPMSNNKGTWYVGVSLSPLNISILHNAVAVETLSLDNVEYEQALKWLDAQLNNAGLTPASTGKIPYKLPDEAAEVTVFHASREGAALRALAAWFDLANDVLTNFAIANDALQPGPSPVRCWPHHFDIATYVGLESGDFETARGVGVGLSPGDESYAQPYFYINPWPHPAKEDLPQLPLPGHWHTESFVGAIATGEEVVTLNDLKSELPLFVAGAFDIGLKKLGF